jgi:hypothetical protein
MIHLTVPLLHCTEVSQQTDEMGQKRGFERTPGMSAISPIVLQNFR